MSVLRATVLLIATLTFCSGLSVGQTITPAEPIGGVSRLSLLYYSIDFTPAQRQLLNYKELEMIFAVSEDGTGKLSKVNGIADGDILDSLYRAVLPQPAFHPRRADGVAEFGLFIVHLTYPVYGQRASRNGYYQYREPRMDDFEYIDHSGSRMDLLLGGVANTFAGSAQHYLCTGGGAKVDLLFANRNGQSFGFAMNIYGNRLRREYPLVTLRSQERVQSILMIGGAFAKRIRETARRELSLQIEANYVLQNLVTTDGPYDNYYVQANGFSPGVVLHYSFPLGKDRLSNYYGRPALIRNKANVHAGIRPVFMDGKAASGVMFEAGVAYRLQFLFVREFRLRADFFE